MGRRRRWFFDNGERATGRGAARFEAGPPLVIGGGEEEVGGGHGRGAGSDGADVVLHEVDDVVVELAHMGELRQ